MNVVFNCDWLSLCLSQVCLFMGTLSLRDVVLPDVLPTNLFNCSFCFLLPKADTFRCSFNPYCNMQALELILCSYTMHVYSSETFSCSLKRKGSEVRLPWRSDQQLNEKNLSMNLCIHIYMLTCVCMYVSVHCQENYWALGRLCGEQTEADAEKKFPFLLLSHLQGMSYLWDKLGGTAEEQPIKQALPIF